MAKKAQERWPQHRQGKRCGYEEFEDGSIQVAPLYADAIEAVVDNRMAVDALLKAVTSQCHALLEEAVKAERRFWNNVREDYGLDFEQSDYSYDRATKRIIRRPKKVAGSKNEAATD